eukprot:148157-Pyramimonas_sp.AAC.1
MPMAKAEELLQRVDKFKAANVPSVSDLELSRFTSSTSTTLCFEEYANWEVPAAATAKVLADAAPQLIRSLNLSSEDDVLSQSVSEFIR